MNASVVIRREWAGGVVWWSADGWVAERHRARVYPSALVCPSTLPMEQRTIHRSWHGCACYVDGNGTRWATIEWDE